MGNWTRWFAALFILLGLVVAGFAYDSTHATVAAAPAPSLTMANPSGEYGTVTQLQAFLKTNKGTGIAGETITFTINGAVVGQDTTDATGAASMYYQLDLPAGTYTTQATFAGNRSYGAATTSGTLTVIKATATIWYSDFTTPLIGDPLKLSAVVETTSSGWTDVGPVIFTLSKAGVQIGQWTASGSDGIIKLDTGTTWPEVGVYDLTMVGQENAYFYGFQGTATITVAGKPTIATLCSYQNPIPWYAADMNWNLCLNHGPNWEALPGKVLSLTVNGSLVASGITDEAGRVAVTWSNTLPIGSYPMEVRFDGDAEWAPSTDTTTLVVEKGQPNIQYAMEFSPRYVGDPLHVGATVYFGTIRNTDQAGPVVFTLTKDGQLVGEWTVPVQPNPGTSVGHATVYDDSKTWESGVYELKMKLLESALFYGVEGTTTITTVPR